MKLLDLFCGAGGASMGYHRAGFEVVGVDIRPQPHYPFKFIQGDALSVPLDGFNVIHASPPCQRYCKQTPLNYRTKHPDLINAIRQRLKKTGKAYVIENIPGAKDLLIQPIMLCGSMFALPIRRHRYFEIRPFFMIMIPPCNHKKNAIYITGTPKPKDGSPRRDPSVIVKRKALGTPWMTIKGMDEAIPPAYTEFIGRKFLEIITN